jgi:hypothetical protein
MKRFSIYAKRSRLRRSFKIKQMKQKENLNNKWAANKVQER